MQSRETNTFDLDKEVQAAQSIAKRIIEDTGELMPMFLAWSKDEGGPMMLTAPWADDDEKERILRMMKATFLIYNVERYMLVSEVWTAKSSVDDPLKDLMPSERPDKQECLAITYTDEKGSQMFYWPIHRDAKGKPKIGEQEKLAGFGSFSGKMTELLPAIDAPVCPQNIRNGLLEKVSRECGFAALQVRANDVKPNKEHWH